MLQKNIALQVKLRPGLIVRLITALSVFGLKLSSHKQNPPNADGLSQLLLTLEGQRELDKEVRSALLAIEGVVQFVSEPAAAIAATAPAATAPEPSARQVMTVPPPATTAAPINHELQQLLRDTFFQLERAFPNILEQVRRFGTHLETKQRDSALFSLGRQLGRRIYRNQYAEGTPLPLAQALLRIVTPTLRALTPVEIRNQQVILAECWFCDAIAGGVSSCAFLAGLIQGLLEDSPATLKATATISSCRTNGQLALNSCICEINLAQH